MKRVDPFEDFLDEGFEAAIQITAEETAMILRGKIEEEVIAFGRENEATIDERAGEIILLQMPDGKQYMFPIIGLADAMEDVA